MLAEHSFCWRSVFTKAQATTTGSPPFIPHVRGIHVDDSLHIYFAANSAPDVLLGSFLVKRPAVVATADTAALGRVLEPELETALFEIGYPHDPHLKVFTGFYLKPDLYPMPPATPPAFKGRNAIVNLEGAKNRTSEPVA